MDYQLYAKAYTTHPLARGTFDNDFAAEDWARRWATDQGRRGLVERDDGKLNSLLFRTHAGQW